MKPSSSSVKRYFDKTYLYLAKTAVISLRAQIVHEFLGFPSNISLLDVGCGNGAISLQFISKTNRLTLLDISEKMLGVARNNTPEAWRGRVTFLNHDFLRWQTRRQYDVVLCLGVLAHVPHVESAVAKLASLVKSGGQCYLQFTDQEKPAARICHAAFSLRQMARPGQRYNTQQLRYSGLMALVGRQGLTIEGERRYLLVLPGIDRLPERILYRYYRFTLENPILSRQGIEVIWRLSKGGSSNADQHRANSTPPSTL